MGIRNKDKKAFKIAMKASFRELVKHKKLAFFSVAGSLVSSIMAMTTPIVFGYFIDSLISGGFVEFRGVYVASLGVFFVWILAKIIYLFSAHMYNMNQTILGRTSYVSYLFGVIEDIVLLPISFFKKINEGELTHVISWAGNSIDTIVVQVYSRLFDTAGLLIVGFTLGFMIQPKLSIVLAAGAVVYGLLLYFSVKDSAILQQEARDAWRKLWQKFGDAISNITAVKLFTTEKEESEKLNKLAAEALEKQLKPIRLTQKVYLYQQTVSTITSGIIIFLSIGLISDGSLTVGGLTIFISYISFVFTPLSQLAYMWRSIENGANKIEDTEEFKAQTKEFYGGEETLGSFDSITFNKVTFGYEKNHIVLKNISVEIKKGQTVALVGESGEGKSTFIQLLSGFYKPTKGKILYNGKELEKYGVEKIRSKMAFVPQDVVLFDDTIKENIRYGTKANQKKVLEAAAQANAVEFIESFPKKWRQVVGVRGVKLSGGQKQRVAIARAFLRDPELLVLDESTSALDAKAEHEIQQSLEKLMENRTTLIIAHRFSTVRHADRILVFKGGQIVEDGTHQQLIDKENGVYRELYDLQIGLH